MQNHRVASALESGSPLPIAVLKLGRIVTTRAAKELIDNKDILAAIQRHQAGDWGEMAESDRKLNDQALSRSGRVRSFYRTTQGLGFIVETEPDRSITTIFLPEET